MNLEQAKKHLMMKRYTALQRAHFVREEMAKDDDFVTAQSEIADLAHKVALGDLAAANKLQRIQGLYDDVLAKHGYTRKSLRPRFSCAKCNDTGYNQKGMCDCLVSLLTAVPSLGHTPDPDKTFDSRRNKTDGAKVFDYFRDYADSPDNHLPNISLFGSTGTGKTHLLNATALRLDENHKSFALFTAFALDRYFLKIHTSDSTSADRLLGSIIDVDYLLIDDLGTEPIYKNVTLNYTFTLLNERLLNNKHTVVTTNLSPESLIATYTERIFSRLCDKTSTKVLSLQFSDQRLTNI